MREGEELDLDFIRLDSAYSHYKAENVTIGNYDRSVIEAEGTHIKAKKVGYTYADADAGDGITAEILIYVYPAGFDFSEDGKYPVSVGAVQETYRLNLKENELKQIRVLIQYSNGSWKETGDAADGVVYFGYNEDLISVDRNGMIRTKGAVGETRVTASVGSFEVTYRIKINKQL